MRKVLNLTLMFLALALVGQRSAQAGPLGLAGDYNIFVFHDIEQWGTDVEGRVAAGGNAIYGRPDTVVPCDPGIMTCNGFAVASKTPVTEPGLNLVVGGNVNLTNGSVGFLDPISSGSPSSQKGDVVYGGTATIVQPVGYGSLQSGHPIDFVSEQNRLTALSQGLGGMNPNGTTTVLKNGGATYEIDLTGTSASRNVFSVLASDITQNIGFVFDAPDTSTMIVNIIGDTASLMRVGFYFKPIPGGPAIPGEPDHAAGYPYSQILFNFPTATLIDIDQIAIDGSLLAPLAHVAFGLNSHIDGNLIADSLLGQGEAHNRLFAGTLSDVPEPATLLLFAVGLAGMIVRRRTK